MGRVSGNWLSTYSCGWHRYSKIIPITANLITGGFALRTVLVAAMRTTLTRLVASATTLTMWIGIPAGIRSPGVISDSHACYVN